MRSMCHNAAKGVPRNVVINGERMSVKNIDLYKRVLEAEKKEDAVMEGSFKRINKCKNVFQQTINEPYY